MAPLGAPARVPASLRAAVAARASAEGGAIGLVRLPAELVRASALQGAAGPAWEAAVQHAAVQESTSPRASAGLPAEQASAAAVHAAVQAPAVLPRASA